MTSYMLNHDDCILLVIDIQDRLHTAMEPETKDLSVKNAGILLEVAHAYNLPVIVTEQYPKGLGKTIGEIERHIRGLPRHEKLYFSCYREGSVRNVFTACERKTVIVTGIETHVCVLQTVLDLCEAGYRVFVASDAVSSRRATDRISALKMMAHAGALVCSTESIAFMLMEKAGTEAFKRLSPLFKE
ncbi:MAG: isochorismatase family protein [Desulfomonilia bacterium]